MTDCYSINQQLLDAQTRLTEIEQELRDPSGTCKDEGIEPGSDECILFIRDLHDQAGELENTIAALQPFENICQVLVGTWYITITDCGTGQVRDSARLSIDALDTYTDMRTGPSAKVYGSLLYASDPVQYDLFNATYVTQDAPGPFLLSFQLHKANDNVVFWSGQVDLGAQPPTMHNGLITWDVGEFCWTALK